MEGVSDSRPPDPPRSVDDARFATPILPGEYLDMREPLDSMASLAAVHGSPTEWHDYFTFLSGEPDEGDIKGVNSGRDDRTPSTWLNGFTKMILFIPYLILVGLAPLMFPRHLSTITFSPIFGYVSRPTTPFMTFGHHARMFPCHIAAACFALVLLSVRSMLFATAIITFTVGATWWAWHDFDPQCEDVGCDLGTDDRMSIYWIIKGIYLGSNDMVCSMGDLNRLCTDSDLDDPAGIASGLEISKHVIREPTIDYVIQVPGEYIGESSTEMRIVIQCFD